MPNNEIVYTNNQYYGEIATAIRNKNGQTTLYKPSEMGPAIDSLVVSGQAIRLQDKEVNPTTSTQTISKDAGYTGLGVVTINAIQTEEKTTSINGDVVPTQGKYLTKVTVEVPSGVNNQNKTVIPSGSQQVVQPDTGYSGLGLVTVRPIPSDYIVPTGTMTISDNGTFNIAQYASVDVDVDTGDEINNQSKTISPTETRQYITPDSGYTGLSQVVIEPISSTYIGSDISRKSATDLTVSGATVSVPAGYYSATASKSVATAMHSNPTVGINASGLITASHAQSTGYVTGGTTTATMQLTTKGATTITPSAATQTVVASGVYTTGIIKVAAVPTDTTNTFTANGTYTPASGKWFDEVTVDVPSNINNQVKTATSSTATQTIRPDTGYSGLSQVTINAMPVATISNNALEATSILESSNNYGVKASVTIPAGYYNTTTLSTILSDILPAPETAITVSQMLSGYQAYDYQGKLLTGSMPNNAPSDIVLTDTLTSTTIPVGYHSGSGSVSHTTTSIPNPQFSFAASTGVVTASNSWTKGYTTNTNYSNTYTVPSMTIPTAVSTSGSGTKKITVTPSTTSQYINIPTGYNGSAAYFQINAMTAGSATPQASISATGATVSVGNGTLTFSKSITLTPQVNAGYISAGTAAARTVSLTATVITKAAATITPGATAQTISANQYLTGAQTIAGDADLVAKNIKSGVNIFGVAGDFTADATATASDIIAGETAYVDGAEVTGTLVVNKYYTGASAPASSLGNNGDIYFQN